MAKFRKKPIEVEAEQFVQNLGLPFANRGPVVCRDHEGWFVETIHGTRTPIEYGDWIILEPRGQCQAYPCKPDIFEATYEAVP